MDWIEYFEIYDCTSFRLVYILYLNQNKLKVHLEPMALMDFIGTPESSLRQETIKKHLYMQLGGVEATDADVSDLKKEFDFEPSTLLGRS